MNCSRNCSSRTNCWKRTTNYSTILRRLMTNSTKNCWTSLRPPTNCWTRNCSRSLPRLTNCCSTKNPRLTRTNCWMRNLRQKNLMSLLRWTRNLMHRTKRRNRHRSWKNCCSMEATKNYWMSRPPRNSMTNSPHRSTSWDRPNCSNWTRGFRLRSSRDWTNCCSMEPRMNCSVAKYYCCWKAGEATRCLTKNQGPHCSRNCQTRNYWMANRPTSCSRAETRCSTRAPKMSCYTIRWRT